LSAVTAGRRALGYGISKPLHPGVSTNCGEEESGGEDDLFHALSVLKHTPFTVDLHKMFRKWNRNEK
jgi:hypothetical protein